MNERVQKETGIENILKKSIDNKYRHDCTKIAVGKNSFSFVYLLIIDFVWKNEKVLMFAV